MIRVFERAKTVYVLDRAATVIGSEAATQVNTGLCVVDMQLRLADR
jgi:hypothetical protein